jgi:hypothetical protein
MNFIQIAYCVTVPVLLLLLWFGKKQVSHFSKNTLAVSNLLLIGHSVFLIRQLLGFYYIVKQYGELPTKMDQPIDFASIRLLLLMLLPFLSLIGLMRRNVLFSLVLLVLLYGNHPVHTWNTFDLFTKILFYLCLLCSGYALLWLLKKLPYQLL